MSLVAATILLAGCAGTPDRPALEAGDLAEAVVYLEQYIQDQLVDSGTVGLSVVIADRDGLVWSEGFGYADVEAEVPVRPDTLFDVASVSKVFTATAIMQLAERGSVDLDSPVTTYLPEFRMASRFEDDHRATVRNLLTHHSGIQPDWLKGMLFTSPVETPDLRFTRTTSLLQDVAVCWPAEHVWAYSNLGYSLLGSIIHEQPDAGFYDYMAANVLGAIGMTESTFDLTPSTYEGRSKGYADGSSVPHLVEREVPAGGLATSADELGAFISAYVDPLDASLLDWTTREQMFARQNAHVERDLGFSQGLGWMIGNHGFDGLGRVVFHDGGEWSANTTLTLLPDQGYGFAILTNSAEGASITPPITREIIRVMQRVRTGEEPTEYARPADTDAAPDLTLVGTYLYQSLGIVEVFERRGDLWAESGGLGMRMMPNEAGRYRLQPLLMGFIPLSIPFLEPIEISFAAVDGDMISGVYQDGQGLPETGVRVDRPDLSPIWYEREGTYELINADPNEFPIIAPWEFAIADGFPSITGALYGSFPFAMVLMPQNESLTFWGGLGRRTGDTIRFRDESGDTFIEYQGFVYRKTD